MYLYVKFIKFINIHVVIQNYGFILMSPVPVQNRGMHSIFTSLNFCKSVINCVEPSWHYSHCIC